MPLRQLGPVGSLLPCKIHAVYAIVNAQLSPVFYWPGKGGMFSGPVDKLAEVPAVGSMAWDGLQDGQAMSWPQASRLWATASHLPEGGTIWSGSWAARSGAVRARARAGPQAPPYAGVKVEGLHSSHLFVLLHASVCLHVLFHGRFTLTYAVSHLFH